MYSHFDHCGDPGYQEICLLAANAMLNWRLMDGEMDIVGYMPSGEVRLTQSHWSHVGGQVMLLGVEVVRTQYDLGATDDHGSVHRLVSVESAPPVRVIGRKGVLSDLEEGCAKRSRFFFSGLSWYLQLVLLFAGGGGHTGQHRGEDDASDVEG